VATIIVGRYLVQDTVVAHDLVLRVAGGVIVAYEELSCAISNIRWVAMGAGGKWSLLEGRPAPLTVEHRAVGRARALAIARLVSRRSRRTIRLVS
jgi:hypothetical protein